MANLEIVGEKLGCYLYIYINDKAYCLDNDNSVLNLELPQGAHTMTVIGTRTKDYCLNSSLKSMSFGIKPALLQGCRDRKFLNHILGWSNKTCFFVKKINMEIRSRAKISLEVKDYCVFNFFDVKEIVKDVEITTNARITVNSTEAFRFVSQNQKNRYYAVQFLLLLLKLFLNIGYMVWVIIDGINYVTAPQADDLVRRYYPSKFDIVIDSVFTLLFFARFVFYCVKICKILRDNSDVMKE